MRPDISLAACGRQWNKKEGNHRDRWGRKEEPSNVSLVEGAQYGRNFWSSIKRELCI